MVFLEISQAPPVSQFTNKQSNLEIMQREFSTLLNSCYNENLKIEIVAILCNNEVLSNEFHMANTLLSHKKIKFYCIIISSSKVRKMWI